MPNDINVWIVGILVAGMVLGLALWLGRPLSFRKKKGGLTLKVNNTNNKAATTSDISVGANAVLMQSKTGDIAGLKKEGVQEHPPQALNVDVLREGKVIKSTTGDIVGIKENSKNG